MTTVTRNQTDEMQVRELIDRWVRAVRAKDVNALMLSYEPNILLYDLAPPLLYRGANGYRKSWQEWFAPFLGAVGYEIHDLNLSVSDNVAFSTSINRISGTKTGEEGQFDVWIRATVGYRKQDGQWLIAHEHFSVPFYMDGSFKAAIDLTP